MKNREKGRIYEEQAARFLDGQGMRIISRNFACRRGEIDIIGCHEGYLVFVEVKFRTGSGKGSPEEAVGPAKQLRICRTADYYRFLNNKGDDTPVRYDVVAVSGGKVRWHRNAFPHRSGGHPLRRQTAF